MSSPMKALTVEWLKSVGLGVLATSFLYVAMPWMFFYLIWFTSGHDISGAGDPDDPLSNRFHYYVTYVSGVILHGGGMAVMAATRYAPRNRVQPVSTEFLANWNLLSIAGTVAVFNVLTQFGCVIVFGSEWPIINTTVAVGSLTAVLISAGMWLRDCRLHRLIPALLWVGGWGYWCVRKLHGGDLGGEITGWHQWTLIDVVMIISGWLVSWILMKSGYAHYRRGDSIDGWLLLFLTDPGRLLATGQGSNSATQFVSPRQAFLKMDGQRNRLQVSVSILGFSTLLCFILCSMARGDLQSLNESTPMFLFFAIAMGFLTGILSAAGVHAQVTREMIGLISTLPVSDRTLGRYFTVSIARFSIVVGVALLATIIIAVVFGVRGLPPGQFTETFMQTSVYQLLGPSAAILIPLSCLILAWAGCGLGASLAMTSHRIIAEWFVGATFLLIVLGTAALAGIPGTEIVAAGLMMIFAVVVCGCGTLWITAKAKRRMLITASQANLCIAAGLIICLATWLFVPFGFYGKTICASGSLLLLLPVASIPTALASGRHR